MFVFYFDRILLAEFFKRLEIKKNEANCLFLIFNRLLEITKTKKILYKYQRALFLTSLKIINFLSFVFIADFILLYTCQIRRYLKKKGFNLILT